MTIPAADPKANYVTLREDIDQALRDVLDSGSYILGINVERFQSNFAGYNKVKHCVGCASGTDAIHLALRASGVKNGDLVVTPSHTAVATVSAISWIGAQPVFVDIDPDTYTIDPNKLEATIKKLGPDERISAMVVVHLYGHPADMESLTFLSERFEIPLVEDCAQAPGAKILDQNVGTFGQAGTYSFYPTKNLGALGDAGAIVSNDGSFIKEVRLLSQYGWINKNMSEKMGYNSRLDEIQASILNVKLKYLDLFNDQRREIAKIYSDRLGSTDISIPVEIDNCRHVFHQYVIRTSKRDSLRKYLETQGIYTAVLYPVPVHLQPGFRHVPLLGEGQLEVTERVCEEILSLPLYPELGREDVLRVTDTIRRYLDGN